MIARHRSWPSLFHAEKSSWVVVDEPTEAEFLCIDTAGELPLISGMAQRYRSKATSGAKVPFFLRAVCCRRFARKLAELPIRMGLL